MSKKIGRTSHTTMWCYICVYWTNWSSTLVLTHLQGHFSFYGNGFHLAELVTGQQDLRRFDLWSPNSLHAAWYSWCARLLHQMPFYQWYEQLHDSIYIRATQTSFSVLHSPTCEERPSISVLMCWRLLGQSLCQWFVSVGLILPINDPANFVRLAGWPLRTWRVTFIRGTWHFFTKYC